MSFGSHAVFKDKYLYSNCTLNVLLQTQHLFSPSTKLLIRIAWLQCGQAIVSDWTISGAGDAIFFLLPCGSIAADGLPAFSKLGATAYLADFGKKGGSSTQKESRALACFAPVSLAKAQEGGLPVTVRLVTVRWPGFA